MSMLATPVDLLCTSAWMAFLESLSLQLDLFEFSIFCLLQGPVCAVAKIKGDRRPPQPRESRSLACKLLLGSYGCLLIHCGYERHASAPHSETDCSLAGRVLFQRNQSTRYAKLTVCYIHASSSENKKSRVMVRFQRGHRCTHSMCSCPRLRRIDRSSLSI